MDQCQEIHSEGTDVLTHGWRHSRENKVKSQMIHADEVPAAVFPSLISVKTIVPAFAVLDRAFFPMICNPQPCHVQFA